MGEPLDWHHEAQRIGERGIQAERIATDAERTAVAQALGLVACSRLAARYRLRGLPHGRISLTGQIEADVTQSCVVTLAPVAAAIREDIDVEFWPAEDVREAVSSTAFDPLGPDDPEPIEHGRVEVGRIVYEHLAAALDPYPRVPGAELTWEGDDGDDERPFAALARLKPKR